MSMVVTPLASHRARTVDWTQESGCARLGQRESTNLKCNGEVYGSRQQIHRCGCVIPRTWLSESGQPAMYGR